MSRRTSTVKQRVECGLKTIPKDKKISVNLRELVYVHKVLQEYMCFFHQPLHYQEMKDIEEFLGTESSPGAFGVLHKACYRKLKLPKEIINDERFYHKLPPDYYEERKSKSK